MLGTLLVLIGGLGTVGFYVGRVLFAGEVTTTKPQAIVKEFAPPEDNLRVFEQGGFSIKLPKDWKYQGYDNRGQYNRHSWQATEKNADNRWLEIYVDRVPTNRAFNRLLPVVVDENKVIVAGSVSDNCTAFTGSQGANRPSSVKSLVAKWQGVTFNCDMANYARNVVGVGTPESGTTVRVPGASGERAFVFVYIDHNISPDYQILEKALASLSVE